MTEGMGMLVNTRVSRAVLKSQVPDFEKHVSDMHDYQPVGDLCADALFGDGDGDEDGWVEGHAGFDVYGSLAAEFVGDDGGAEVGFQSAVYGVD